VAIGDRMARLLRGWHRETPYAAAIDWVFPSLKLRGKKPISGSQFVKDYIRPRFIKYGLIDATYKGRAGLHAFRHYLPFLTMSSDTGSGLLKGGKYRSKSGCGGLVTQHSL